MLNHTKELMLFNEELSAFRRTAEERIATLDAQIVNLERDLGTLRQTVATSKAEGEEAGARALAAEGRLAAADAAATASQERQATAESTITRLQSELAAATTQLATAAENHARVTAGRNSNATEKAAALKALEETNAAHRQQVAALEARGMEIQQSLDAERAATEAARQEAQRVQDELRQANVRHEQQLTVIEQSGRGRMEAVRAAQAKDADIARLQEELKGAQTACKPGYDAEETRRLLVKEMLELWETKLKPQNLATGAPASEFPKLPKETIAPKVKAFADRLRMLSPLTARRHEGSEPAVVHSLADETRTGLLLSLKELFEIYDATLKIFYRRDEGAAAAAAVGGAGASRVPGGNSLGQTLKKIPNASAHSFRRNRKSRRSTRKTRR
jgi:DNA repair exonuclease SbcCD ATPase subunit